MNHFLCWFVKITGWLPQALVFRTKIHYSDPSVQKRTLHGPVILASNHTSVMDFAVWMFVFWRSSLHCLMAEILFQRSRLFSWFLRALGGIRVNRDLRDFTFVHKSVEILQKGGLLEIYPEARLPRPGEQRPLPFKPSTVYISMLSGAPILPVYTNGKYFTAQRAQVIIGTPIDVRAMIDPDLSDGENIQNITSFLQKQVTKLELELEEKCKK